MASAITTSSDRASILLEWYDRHHRAMPWRVSPAARRSGTQPDPYRIWLSEVMLQQTTVAAVIDYFQRFVKTWPTVQALAAAPDGDVMAAWAGLGYYSRARNLIRCARVVANELDGRFPETEEGLLALPGVGPYTAAAIAAIAFDHPAVVIDGNVERVMARLFAQTEPLPSVKPQLRDHAASLTPSLRPGDYAQAVMDLGATVCTPKNPACGICPWMQYCQGRLQGIATSLPAKLPKKAKPVRMGFAWVAFDGTNILVERRPSRGLLGGMLAVPTSDWGDAPNPAAPVSGEWHRLGEIRHTFTHFHLRLDVMAAQVDRDVVLPDGGHFMNLNHAIEAMPTVFAKVCNLARNAMVRDLSGDVKGI